MEKTGYSFQVFQPTNQTRMPILLWILIAYLLLFVAITVALIIWYQYLFVFLLLQLLITGLLYFFYKKNQHGFHFIPGRFDGEIIFFEKGIQIKDQWLPIEHIQNLEIDNGDFLYKYMYSNLFHPKISIGVGNNIRIKTKSGKQLQCYFQQQYDNEMMRMEKLIHYYQQKNILTHKNLIQITQHPFS